MSALDSADRLRLMSRFNEWRIRRATRKYGLEVFGRMAVEQPQRFDQIRARLEYLMSHPDAEVEELDRLYPVEPKS